MKAHNQVPTSAPGQEALSAQSELMRFGQLAEMSGMTARTVDLVGEPLATHDGQNGAQALRAIVGAGNSYFGVVECTDRDNNSFFAVTRVGSTAGDAQTGAFVGAFTVEGWDGQIELNADARREAYSEDVSLGLTLEGQQLKVINRSDRPVNVTDKNPVAAKGSLRSRLGFRGLRQLLRRQSAQNATAEPAWALGDTELLQARQRQALNRRVRESVHRNTALPQARVNDVLEQAAFAGTVDEREILIDGTLHGRPATTPEVARDASRELDQRRYLADVAARAPRTAEALAAGEVAGLHGTRSSTLASAIEFGGKLLPARRAAHEGIFVVGGDAVSAVRGNGEVQLDDTIPFASLTQAGVQPVVEIYAGRHQGTRTTADLIAASRRLGAAGRDGLDTDYNRLRAEKFAEGFDKAAQYIDGHPDSAYAQLVLDDFPVLFGVSRRALGSEDIHDLTHGTATQLEEFRPMASELSLAEGELPVVAVPADRVSSVQSLFQERQWPVTVVAIEDLAPTRAQ